MSKMKHHNGYSFVTIWNSKKIVSKYFSALTNKFLQIKMLLITSEVMGRRQTIGSYSQCHGQFFENNRKHIKPDLGCKNRQEVYLQSQLM
jgi:hypothetical protein